MIDPGGDQRRRVRNAPETVRQRDDLQVAEIRIVLHPITRHDYPSNILIRALSTHPESSVAGIVRRINDVQSRGVRSRASSHDMGPTSSSSMSTVTLPGYCGQL